MHNLIERAKAEKRSLLETEAKELLKEYGIPVPDFKLIKSEDEIIGLAKEINFPIAMKIVSPDIIHKSDAGGVKLRIPEYPDGNSEGIRTLNRNIRTSYRFNFY